MHLGDEIRNLKLTILIPLLLFVWFILAFLWDGTAFKSMRNRYDVPAPAQQVAPHDVQKPGTLN
jgi:hypothetical protein